ncbi:hypothetical protein C7972_1189 [Arenibacter sp. ARW7G5Y1]|nr:hypothetical protein C7972_1189 [Arenibacter sp. ARW7G5Y1]
MQPPMNMVLDEDMIEMEIAPINGEQKEDFSLGSSRGYL